jgi:hypothetical protein
MATDLALERPALLCKPLRVVRAVPVGKDLAKKLAVRSVIFPRRPLHGSQAADRAGAIFVNRDHCGIHVHLEGMRVVSVGATRGRSRSDGMIGLALHLEIFGPVQPGIILFCIGAGRGEPLRDAGSQHRRTQRSLV